MNPQIDYADDLREQDREIRRLKRLLARRERMLLQLQGVQKNSSRLLASVLAELDAEKQRSDALLRNILPEDVIERLENSDQVIADAIESASVVFADFVGFTPRAAGMSATELVSALNELYSAFDEAAQTIGIEKIKTIGDAYLAVSGLDAAIEDHADRAVDFALTLRDLVDDIRPNGIRWPVRVGVHSGALTAGVIGKHKFAYDIWGDTVNVASRVQSACPEDDVLVSDATAALLSSRFTISSGRTVPLKGRGARLVYSVFRHRATATDRFDGDEMTEPAARD